MPPGVLGEWDAHMHVVRHQMTLDNLAFFLPGQRVEDPHPVAGANLFQSHWSNQWLTNFSYRARVVR